MGNTNHGHVLYEIQAAATNGTGKKQNKTDKSMIKVAIKSLS